MDKSEFKDRTKRFGLRVLRLISQLESSSAGRILGKQLLSAGTSVGANYRAACRARSRADFIGKLKIAEEVCDESLYWMEMIVEGKLLTAERVSGLGREGEEILSLLVASLKTARAHLPQVIVNR